MELVAINGNYCIYKAKSSGTIVFENCDSKTTVRILPKETPFDALLNMLGRGKKLITIYNIFLNVIMINIPTNNAISILFVFCNNAC